MSNYNNLANVGLGALQGQANAGQTYANNMSSIAQQSAALPLLMPTNHQVFRQQLVAERLVRLPVQVLPAFWEHQHLGALALVLVSDCLDRCFKG